MEREVNLLELIGRQAVTIETLQGDLRRAMKVNADWAVQNANLTKQIAVSQAEQATVSQEKPEKAHGVD